MPKAGGSVRANPKAGFTDKFGITTFAELTSTQDAQMNSMICQHGLNNVAVIGKHDDFLEERTKAATGDHSKPVNTKDVVLNMHVR